MTHWSHHFQGYFSLKRDLLITLMKYVSAYKKAANSLAKCISRLSDF